MTEVASDIIEGITSVRLKSRNSDWWWNACFKSFILLLLASSHNPTTDDNPQIVSKNCDIIQTIKKKTASTGGRRTNTIIALCVLRDDWKCNYVLDTFFLFHGPFIIISSNSLLFLCHVQILHLCSLLFCSWKVTKVNFKENVNDFDEWLDMILYITP